MTILIVEDEIKIASLLADYFNQAGYQTHCIDHGDEVVDGVIKLQPALILLDIMLPGQDGISLCKAIRQFSNIPIIIITARVDEIDRLLGLELGADDYICKPFSPREVVARAKAVLRRSQSQQSINPPQFQLDDNRLQFNYQQKTTEFTHIEYQLLKLLANEPGRIFSRNQLMDSMYNDHRIVSDRTIDSHIKKIRKKLSEIYTDKEFIHSVYGAGYRFSIETIDLY